MWESLPEKDLLEFLKLYAISDVFHSTDRIKYNTTTYGYWYYKWVEKTDLEYKKEWHDIIPRSGDGTFRTRDVARWLWQRFVADGWKNYGVLQQTHLYMLLALGRDLGYVLHDDLASDPIRIPFIIPMIYDVMACDDLLLTNVIAYNYGGWDHHRYIMDNIEPRMNDLFGNNKGLHTLFNELQAHQAGKAVQPALVTPFSLPIYCNNLAKYT